MRAPKKRTPFDDDVFTHSLIATSRRSIGSRVFSKNFNVVYQTWSWLFRLLIFSTSSVSLLETSPVFSYPPFSVSQFFSVRPTSFQVPSISYPRGWDILTNNFDDARLGRAPIARLVSSTSRENESNPENAEIEYVSNAICWKLDVVRGAIAAFDSSTRKPLWSDDGIVFRFVPTPPQRSSSSAPFLNATPTAQTNVSSAFGRVYFLLDGDDAFSTSEGETVAFRRVIALDPQAEGKLVWTRRADEFASLFPDSETRPAFVRPPQALADDELAVETTDGRETKTIRLDAATGRLQGVENASK